MNNINNQSEKPNYLLVDLQWTLWLILFPLISSVLFLAFMFQITKEDNAIKILSYAGATFFSPQGNISEEKEIITFKQILKKNPTTKFKITDNFLISISSKEIEYLTPKETRIALAKKIFTPFYKEGTIGIVNFATNIKTQQQIINNLSVWEIFTQKIHKLYQKWLIIASIILFFFTIIYSLISFKLGRYFSLGLLILENTIPWYFLITFLLPNFTANLINRLLSGKEIILGSSINAGISIIWPIILATTKFFIIIGLLITSATLLGIILWKIFKKNYLKEENV